MNNTTDRTKQTYEESADGLAKYFKGIGPRAEDIARAFELAHAGAKSTVLELGCGDGRDAKDILTRTQNFTAIDYSERLIQIAKQTNPANADAFHVADILTFTPEDSTKYDIIFAFASLLHLNPRELQIALNKYLDYLTPHGVFYLSMKMSEQYREAVKEDTYGWRMFHLYHPDEVGRMLPDGFEEVFRQTHSIGQTDWFEMAIKKVKGS